MNALTNLHNKIRALRGGGVFYYSVMCHLPPLSYAKTDNVDRPQELREQGQLRRQESKHSPLATLVYQIQEASKVLKDEAQHFSDDLSELVQDGKATTSGHNILLLSVPMF